jgi:hypothetical protein
MDDMPPPMHPMGQVQESRLSRPVWPEHCSFQDAVGIRDPEEWFMLPGDFLLLAGSQ